MSEQILRKEHISDASTHCLYLSSPGSSIITIFDVTSDSLSKVELSQRFYYYSIQAMDTNATHFVTAVAQLFKNTAIGLRITSRLLVDKGNFKAYYCGHHIFCADCFVSDICIYS